MNYSVVLKGYAKVQGKRCGLGETVVVSQELYDELSRKGLVRTAEQVEENSRYLFLAPYEKITEAEIREQLDGFNIDHSEAKDKKAAYALLEQAHKVGE
ncbi:hypothetical protein [Metasolibacillus meyeri]|uniref:hypothetical protein n=1 Tax=Metasolibacillus meyeri TaxID=1071052 RepID=UPI000D3000E6|nr:hypothetical protein [Metasolibacillus meyeri]